MQWDLDGVVRYLSGKPLQSQASYALFYGSVSKKYWITAMIAGSCNIEGYIFFHVQSIGNVFPSSAGFGTNRQMAGDVDK